MITDVIRKNGWYQTLNESGKKIQEKHESSLGELQGFTDRFLVFYKKRKYPQISQQQLFSKTLSSLEFGGSSGIPADDFSRGTALALSPVTLYFTRPEPGTGHEKRFVLHVLEELWAHVVFRPRFPFIHFLKKELIP